LPRSFLDQVVDAVPRPPCGGVLYFIRPGRAVRPGRISTPPDLTHGVPPAGGVAQG